MSKIVMTLTNPYRPDPRVAWEARTLVDAGHQVTIIAWDREAELVEHITTEGIEVTRIQNIRSTYSAGVKQSYIIPQFWSAAIKQATELSPEVIHCHDLDTLFIGAQVKKNLACKVVYDAHENYPVSLSLYLPGVATYLLTLWERWLLRFVDHTITASHRFGTELVERGVKPVTIVGNFADVRVYDSISPAQLISIRASLGWKPDDFVVAYIGGFTLDREILPLVETIKTCLDMKLLIAGDGLQRQLIEKAILGQPNIRYIGWIPASDVPVYTKLADVRHEDLIRNRKVAENVTSTQGNPNPSQNRIQGQTESYRLLSSDS